MPFSLDRRSVSLANWREHPFSTWSFQNLREIVPTAAITAGSGGAHEGGHGALADLVLDDGEGRRITALDYLERSHADGFVAMRGGATIAGWQSAHAEPGKPHVVFSVSKSITGMLAGIAAGDGRLDPDAAVTDYVDGIRPGSAYADATVRHLLDMTVSLVFEEDYLDRDGAFDRYRRATLWNPEREPRRTETMLDVIAALPRDRHPHGVRFAYASPNTDMLGIVIERATGERFADYLARKIWRPMGATGEACVTVDRTGSARAAGGICVTAADLARFGALVLDGGRSAKGAQIIPSAWIHDMRTRGDRKAWVDGKAAATLPEGRYRSCWYDVGDGRGSFAAIGIHGQFIWADPESGIVLAKTSSRPVPSDDELTRTEIAMLGRIARTL